jgi:hypothetical protein
MSPIKRSIQFSSAFNGLSRKERGFRLPVEHGCVGLTYNPLFEASRSGYTIGGGGKTATRSTDGQSTVALQGAKSSGKHYCEVVITGSSAPTECIFGFATQGDDTNYLGSYNVSFGYDGASTLYQSGLTGLTSLTRAAISNGSVVSMALDADAKKAWIGVGGVYPGSGDPAAGTNATYTWSSTHSLTAAFRPYYVSVLTLPATPLYQPSGFLGW